jgi:hypothetical protein
MSLSDFGLREFFEDTKALSRGAVTRPALPACPLADRELSARTAARSSTGSPRSVQYPAHLPAVDPDTERIQRIVRAAFRRNSLQLAQLLARPSILPRSIAKVSGSLPPL